MNTKSIVILGAVLLGILVAIAVSDKPVDPQERKAYLNFTNYCYELNSPYGASMSDCECLWDRLVNENGMEQAQKTALLYYQGREDEYMKAVINYCIEN